MPAICVYKCSIYRSTIDWYPHTRVRCVEGFNVKRGCSGRCLICWLLDTDWCFYVHPPSGVVYVCRRLQHWKCRHRESTFFHPPQVSTSRVAQKMNTEEAWVEVVPPCNATEARCRSTVQSRDMAQNADDRRRYLGTSDCRMNCVVARTLSRAESFCWLRVLRPLRLVWICSHTACCFYVGS
jgi:hypothetical protein